MGRSGRQKSFSKAENVEKAIYRAWRTGSSKPFVCSFFLLPMVCLLPCLFSGAQKARRNGSVCLPVSHHPGLSVRVRGGDREGEEEG